MRAALLLLVLVAGFSSCRRTVTHTSSTVATTPDTLIADTIIRSAGTWSAHTSRASHQLDVTINGTSASWSVKSEEKYPGGGSTGGTSSSGLTLSSPSDPWFIFVESPQKLWFFNGSGELTYSLSDGGGSRSGPAIFSGQLQPTNEKIPTDLIPHLPPDLQKLFPPIEPKTERPSF